MQNFPFEAVYEYFARPLVTLGLDEIMFQPKMFTVTVEGEKVVRVAPLPDVGRFFESGGGKDALGDFVRTVMAVVDDMPVCLVLMSEAWYKTIPDPENKGLKAIRHAEA
jgi:hypothetical protein